MHVGNADLHSGDGADAGGEQADLQHLAFHIGNLDQVTHRHGPCVEQGEAGRSLADDARSAQRNHHAQQHTQTLEGITAGPGQIRIGHRQREQPDAGHGELAAGFGQLPVNAENLEAAIPHATEQHADDLAAQPCQQKDDHRSDDSRYRRHRRHQPQFGLRGEPCRHRRGPGLGVIELAEHIAQPFLGQHQYRHQQHGTRQPVGHGVGTGQHLPQWRAAQGAGFFAHPRQHQRTQPARAPRHQPDQRDRQHGGHQAVHYPTQHPARRPLPLGGGYRVGKPAAHLVTHLRHALALRAVDILRRDHGDHFTAEQQDRAVHRVLETDAGQARLIDDPLDVELGDVGTLQWRAPHEGTTEGENVTVVIAHDCRCRRIGRGHGVRGARRQRRRQAQQAHCHQRQRTVAHPAEQGTHTATVSGHRSATPHEEMITRWTDAAPQRPFKHSPARSGPHEQGTPAVPGVNHRGLARW